MPESDALASVKADIVERAAEFKALVEHLGIEPSRAAFRLIEARLDALGYEIADIGARLDEDATSHLPNFTRKSMRDYAEQDHILEGYERALDGIDGGRRRRLSCEQCGYPYPLSAKRLMETEAPCKGCGRVPRLATDLAAYYAELDATPPPTET